MVSIEIVALAAMVAAWLVLYAVFRDKDLGRISFLPFGIIVRIGVSREPLEGGKLGRAVSLYGYLSIILMFLSTIAFYYLAFRTALARLSPGPGEGEAAGFIPLIPGVTIPWDNLVYVAFALGIGVLLHEAAHAIVAVAEGIRLKDAGIAIFLFIPAAFVELDEDQLNRARLISRLKVFSAGVAANILVALAVLAAASALPLVEPTGVKIVGVEEGSPAAVAGLAEGMTILEVNGKPVRSLDDLRRLLGEAGVTNESARAEVYVKVRDADGATRELVVVKEPGRTTIGVSVAEFYDSKLATTINALVLLNIGVGLINAAPILLPLPGAAVLSDGGHIAVHVGEKLLGRNGRYLGAAIGIATLILIIGLLSFQPLDLTP